MSQQERQRLGILVGVKAGEWGLVAAAAVLGLSCRPPKRVWQRYRTEGDPGRVPRRRGQPGLRRKSAGATGAQLGAGGETASGLWAAAGGGGLRAAGATLRPPYVTHRQPRGKKANNNPKGH